MRNPCKKLGPLLSNSVVATYWTEPTVRFLDFPNFGQILMEDLAILCEEWPLNFNQASDWPEISGKSTGMDIVEFTDTPSHYLSNKFGVLGLRYILSSYLFPNRDNLIVLKLKQSRFALLLIMKKQIYSICFSFDQEIICRFYLFYVWSWNNKPIQFVLVLMMK